MPGDPDAATLNSPSLVALLSDLERPPRELIDALRDARERAVDEPALARDLACAELAFLGNAVRSKRFGAELAEAFAGTRRAAREAELRRLRALPDDRAAALFDLAEIRAGALVAGDPQVAEIEAEIDRRLAALRGVDDALRDEVRGRYVTITTGAEELTLDEHIALLRTTRELVTAITARFDDRELRKVARRFGRRVCDQVLARRLEHVLTPRGAVILENLSLLLLLVVLVLLLVERTVDLGPERLRQLLLVDASVCTFFIGEFLFKLALAPARGSWFLRNALTDLLPAIPAALWFAVPTPGSAETAGIRALRILRVTWFARYVQALRPMLGLFRLVLFLAKGMDALVARFSPILNRNFVFFEKAVQPRAVPRVEHDARTLTFRALRREQALVRDLDPAEARRELVARAGRLTGVLASTDPTAEDERAAAASPVARDVPVEHAVEFLRSLRPEDVTMLLTRTDIAALDRVVRIVNAPIIRALPIIRWFRLERPATTPEERVVGLARRIASALDAWRARAVWFADLHGIVTGPQVLDRIATALVKASFRPARNLILFGLFFVFVRLLVGPGTSIGLFLSKFVTTPVLVLGSVCAVALGVGYWLKKIAGEAADQFKLTAEASFIGMLELVKRRSQDDDLEFLARRVFRWEMDDWAAASVIGKLLRAARTGRLQEPVGAPPGLEDELYRVALLYLHFLDGAPLHETDVKVNEQLLANLSLENVRSVYLRHGRGDRRRLRRLSIQGGSVFGPYLWFRCITESVAVETAKRVTDYNRNCLPLKLREIADPAARQRFAAWVRRRRQRAEGRLERVDVPADVPQFATTEFNALDFLSVDPIREAHVRRVFGRGVLALVRREREALIREVFGTRPLHELPRAERTFNFHAFYRQHLSGGRVFFAPWFAVRLAVRSVVAAARKTREIVREVLAPQAAIRGRASGRAPFAVALRKIHRMKAPTLLGGMRLRAAFDPTYAGAPPGWSGQLGFEEVSELERDIGFVGLRDREREELLATAARVRRRVEELHMLVQQHPGYFVETDPDAARRGERAVTVAYLTDHHDLRTLLRADAWLEAELRRMEAPETRLPARTFRRLLAWLARGLGTHPIDAWVRERLGDRNVSRRGRRNFKRAWHDGDVRLRATVQAWTALPAGQAPRTAALARATRIYKSRDEVSREIVALRAVQSLSVLDIRNYRRLVFQLGNYAAEGESPALAEALP